MIKNLVKSAFKDYIDANNHAESEFKKILDQPKKQYVTLMPFSEPLKSLRYAELMRNIFYNTFCSYYGNKNNQDFLQNDETRNKLSNYMFQATSVLDDKDMNYIFAHNGYENIQEDIFFSAAEYDELVELLSHIISDVATTFEKEFTEVLDDVAGA